MLDTKESKDDVPTFKFRASWTDLEQQSLKDSLSDSVLIPTTHLAAQAGNIMCLAVDGTLLIYQLNTLEGTVVFDCPIEHLALDSSGNLLVVADSLGAVHFVHTPSHQVFFSHRVCSTNILHVRSFVNISIITTGITSELIIMLFDDSLIRIRNIPTQQFTLNEYDPITFRSMLKESIATEVTRVDHSANSWMVAYRTGDKKRILVSTEDSIYIYSADATLTLLDTIDCIRNIKKCIPIIQKQLLAVIDNIGDVFIIDLISMVIIAKKLVPDVVDIVAVPDENQYDSSLVCLLKALPNTYSIIVLDVPSLLPCCNEVGNMIISDLMPILLTFTTELYNMCRLISLDVSNEVDPQICFKEICLESSKVVKPSPLKITNIITENFENEESLLQFLSDISDTNILVEFAVSSQLADTHLVNTALEFIRSRLLEIQSPAAHTIRNMHRRLISFKEHLIGHGYIWSTWASFRDSSMLQNVQIALTNNDIDLACLLWARHHIDDDLVTNVQDILLEIPLRIHVPHLLKFLKLILKHQFVSNELHAIQKWIWKFAENIEMILHKPKDALLLLRTALLPEPMNTPNLSQSLSPTAIIRILTENGHDSTSVNKDFYEMIHSRTKALEDILELAVSSEFFITLSDYEKSTPSIIAMSLIDRIQAPELIPNTIEKHVVPFITKHQLPLDQILQSYCNDIIESCLDWEGRVLVVLNMITSIDTKGEVLLECMRRSPIPWSENLDIQIMELSNVVGPFQGEITEQHKLMKLRKMIQGYGINSFNVSDLQLAKRLIPYILKRVDSLTAVEDAFQCVSLYNNYNEIDIYSMRLQVLVKHRSLARFEALLRNGKELEGISDSYSAPAKSAILQEFLCWVDMQLEMHDEGATPDSIEPYILAGKIALNIMGVGNNRTENVYHRIQMIYKNTESILRPSQLVDATFVRSFMDRWIERQLPEAVYGLDKAFRIGNLLQLSRDYILGRVATYWTKSNNLQHVSIICQEIVQNYTDESMDETLMDLLNTLISSFSTVQLHNVAQTVENLLAIVSIFLCYTTKHLEYALKVYKVCDILHHVVLQSDLGYYTNTTQAIEYSAIRKIFSGQYCESGLVISSDKLINNIGIFLVQPDLDKVGIQKGKGKQQSVPVKEKFQDIIDTCIQTRNYQIAFRLLQLFYENEVLESIPISLDKQAMSTSLVYELLEGLFHSVTIDYDYCLACMISLPKSKASGLLQSGITSAGRDYNRIQRIARVGAIAGTLWSQRSFQVTCLDLIKNSHWQNELQTLEIPFEDNIFRNSTNGNTSALKVLVPCLLYQTRHDLELVLDYGECYLLEPDFIYLEYIKQLLSIKLDFPPREQIFKKVKHAINQVANKQKLGTFLLIDCFEKASPYDYELLRFINEMVLELDPNATSVKKHLMMIDILLQYTRTSKPSEVEMSLSFDLDVGIARLEQSITSVWSQYYEYRFKRLPFHLLLKNPVEILNMELDESMINRLLPLARVLNYPTEKVYESLIHKSIEVLKIQLNSKSSVVLSFSSFKPWINKLNDYELAIRTTVFVAGNYPRGEDRILAYKLALEFAERWRNSLQQQENSASLEKARTGWKNVKSLLSIAETEHMLQTHNLQQLDKYVTKPYQLVSQLLTPNPTQPSIEVSVYHQLAEYVSSRNDINLENLKALLIQQLLTSTQERHNDCLIQDQIMFICYNKWVWAVKLLYIFSQQPAHKASTIAKVRALSIALRIQSRWPLEYPVDHCRIRKELLVMLYMVDFEDLGTPNSILHFDSIDKHALAKSLWVSARDNVTGLRVIVKLCLDYEIFDKDLWKNSLEKLLQKGDYCYLLRTLKSILEKEETTSWNFLEALLTQCLLCWFTGFSNHQPNKLVSEGYTTEFYFEMVEYLYTSQRLINPFNPEMINVFEKWMNKTSIDDHGSITLLLGLYGIAKGSSKHFEAYLETQEEGKLVSILETFEEHSSSCLNTPLTEIQEMVFDKVFSTLNTTSQFEMIGKSRFMDRFVKYLIEKDCIVNLLGGCLKANRISEGLKLIKLYTKVYATTVDWSLSDDELVKAFYEKLTVAIE